MAVHRWPGGEVLGFDLETTGIDRFGDRPVSFALVTASGGTVVHRSVRLVDPGCEIPEAATAIHGITTERARREGLTLEQAVEVVIDALLASSSRGVPVTGVNLSFDLTIVDVLSRRLWGEGLVEQGWAGPVLDVLVLDRQMDRYRKGRRTLSDLCDHYDVPLGTAHDASADAEAAVGVLAAMAARFLELGDRSLSDLHAEQMEWHRRWVGSYDVWRRGQGLPGVDPREYWWPVAPEVPVLDEALGAA